MPRRFRQAAYRCLAEYLTKTEQISRAPLKVILLSRPQSGPLESGLRPFRRIKLDDSDLEVGKDVEKYISAKVAELASEQILSPDRLQEVRQALMANADGTFLWVGFVANELKGRSWLKAKEILRGVPKGLGRIYCRLLEQVEDKDRLVPILQWVVLAARPLTLDELAIAAEIRPSDKLTARTRDPERFTRVVRAYGQNRWRYRQSCPRVSQRVLPERTGQY